MGGSSSNTPVMQPTQSQQATKDPWGPSQPYLQQTMGAAANLFNQGIAGSYNPYGGQVLSDVHPWQQQGQNAAMSLAQSEPTGSAYLNNARTAGNQLIQNYGLSPELQNLYNQASTQENPYLQNILNTQGRQIADRVNAAMSGAGRYGSGQHTDVMTRALAESADPILAQDYTRRQQQMQGILEGGLQRQGQWSQLMPTLDQARYYNAGVMQDLGQFYTNRAQAQKNADISVYNALQAYPWENLARYNAIIQGTGGLGGSTVTNQQQAVQQPTTMQRLFGGAAAGAGMGSMFGPVGMGVGALGGGLLGMM